MALLRRFGDKKRSINKASKEALSSLLAIAIKVSMEL